MIITKMLPVFKYICEALLIYIALICTAAVTCAGESAATPRFVSMKSNEVNMRAGPSTRYPILWTMVRKGEPVEVLAEFEHWRKVRDKQGDEAWVHESMVSNKRVVIITGNQLQPILKTANYSSKKICMLEPEVRTNLLTCKQEWCSVQIEKCKGWILRDYLWGVYSNEELH